MELTFQAELISPRAVEYNILYELPRARSGRGATWHSPDPQASTAVFVLFPIGAVGVLQLDGREIGSPHFDLLSQPQRAAVVRSRPGTVGIPLCYFLPSTTYFPRTIFSKMLGLLDWSGLFSHILVFLTFSFT